MPRFRRSKVFFVFDKQGRGARGKEYLYFSRADLLDSSSKAGRRPRDYDQGIRPEAGDKHRETGGKNAENTNNHQTQNMESNTSPNI